jgi:predicted transcriptional regulator
MSSTTRANLHALVDDLPENLLPEAERALSGVTMPVFLTHEEVEGVRRGLADAERGAVVPAEEVFRRLDAMITEKAGTSR